MENNLIFTYLIEKGFKRLFQSPFSAHCLISASTNYSTKGLRFRPCNIDFCILLLATYKDHWVLRMLGICSLN